MTIKWIKYGRFCIFSFLGTLLIWVLVAIPSFAHWADLSVAEVMVGKTQTKITLTFPTGLVAFVDENRDNQLSVDEVRSHQTALKEFLSDRLSLTDTENNKGSLSIQVAETSAFPSKLQTPTNTHSTLLLVYTWLKPVQGLKLHYNLFLPGVPSARCLATIFNSGTTQNFIFSPQNRELSLIPGTTWYSTGNFLLAIAGAFFWGVIHAMSPGHGKTIVGAYLVGSRATPKHACFLGLTTTITHTTGVFALGLVTLFASHYILPEQLYPWLSFLSGLIVVAIGLNLFLKRVSHTKAFIKLPMDKKLTHNHFDTHHTHDHSHAHTHVHDHSHEHPHEHFHIHHTHDHSHEHPHEHFHTHHTHEHSHEHHHHQHEHSHGGHTHSHLPPDVDDTPITWKSLLALGISGGLLPCPSALVLLLSAIALGHVGFGLMLVLAFSLGLAGVLTILGLALVYSKRLFEKLPTKMPVIKALPAVSSLCIALVGLGITTQALMQIGFIRFS